MKQLTFQNKPIDLISVNGEHYIEGALLGDTLEIKKGNRGVQKIYRNHKKEFTPDMAMSIDLPTNGGVQLSRVFSLRGAMLIAMYAKTPPSMEFKSFILDVLEGKKQTKQTATLIKKMQQELLASNPSWKEIIRYKSLGLKNSEIMKLLEIGRDTLRRTLRKMESFCLIAPPKNLEQLQEKALLQLTKRS